MVQLGPLCFHGNNFLCFQIHDSQGCTWQFMYFVSMVVLGAFFVMNLILGVLSGSVYCILIYQTQLNIIGYSIRNLSEFSA